MKPFVFKAAVHNVVDGDTIDVLIDLGFGIYTQQRLRLARINTPEMNSKVEEERVKAAQARQFLYDTIHDKDVIVNTTSKDKYGRYIAEVLLGDKNISDLILEKNLAKLY